MRDFLDAPPQKRLWEVGATIHEISSPDMKAMGLISIQRTATLKPSKREEETRTLAGWRSLDAYVLLGEPGSGKTTAFKQEADELKDSAVFVTARDFLTLGPPPGWRNEILFIDAVDERRSALNSATAPIDGIRQKLKNLGMPRFRLSCREADWIAGGTADLQAVAPSGKVEELWLDPLSDADIHALLESHSPLKVKDVDQFIEIAQRRNLAPLLHNPLLLNLLVDAVSKSDWPDSRSETYELACKQMASEHNPVHRMSETQEVRPIKEYLEIAGKLCALLLLSDAQYLTLDSADTEPEGIQLIGLQPALNLAPGALYTTINSKLFSAEGDRRYPRHRTISEYLGGRAIATLIQEQGLPVQRVLALMTGNDGGVVEPLRGLYGWLTLHCPAERTLLLEADPLGLILYGDVRPFSTSEKLRVLDALRNEATRFPWFRSENWEAHPFGALGTKDMEAKFQTLLRSKSRDTTHQVLLDCVCDAIEYGDMLPLLAPDLEAIVKDTTYTSVVRKSSLSAWIKTLGGDITRAHTLLADIQNGTVVDADDELCGRLLSALYPKQISALEALCHFHPRKAPNLIGWFHMFWATEFPEKTPSKELEVTLDYLSAKFASNDFDDEGDDVETLTHDTRRTSIKLLARGLLELGDGVSDRKLYQWLGIGLNKYGSIAESHDGIEKVTSWLESHPRRLKSIYLAGAKIHSEASKEKQLRLWVVDNHLFRAKRPSDWYRWLLEQATHEKNPALVKHWLIEAAHTAIDNGRQAAFEISLDEVETWIDSMRDNWPLAPEWVQEASTSSLEGWQREEHQRKVEALRKREQKQLERKHLIQPRLNEVFSGTASFGLMGDIAKAYKKRFSDIQGETPLERLVDYLVVTEEEAIKAMAGIKAVLQRNDLPSAAQIEATQLQNKHYLIDSACLLAAELIYQDNPACVISWPKNLVESLVAFYLVNGLDEKCDWFDAACRLRQDVVQPVLLRRALHDMQAAGSPRLPASYIFHGKNGPNSLAAALLPTLIRAIPTAPTKDQLHLLKGHLLPGARNNLSIVDFHKIVNDRLSETSLSIEFRVALLIAGIQIEPNKHLAALIELSRNHLNAIPDVREVLSEQDAEMEKLAERSPETIGKLVEILAKHAIASGTPSTIEDDSPFGGKSRVIHQLTNHLSTVSDLAAGKELRRLKRLEAMTIWSVHLEWRIRKQARLARIANFVSPSPSAVTKVLLNDAPANARDMAALLISQLTWIAKRIRFDETNQLDLFWERDKKGRKKSKTENACRDIIQAMLRDRLLQIGVQIEKEALAAGDKRADLQGSIVSQGERIVVPIEIKKEDHPSVWSAWGDQLEARYTANPSAQGIGVYVVFWFGEKPKPNPKRVRPKSAEHMALLLSSEIPADRLNRIYGLVIDLSQRNS